MDWNDWLDSLKQSTINQLALSIPTIVQSPKSVSAPYLGKITLKDFSSAFCISFLNAVNSFLKLFTDSSYSGR